MGLVVWGFGFCVRCDCPTSPRVGCACGSGSTAVQTDRGSRGDSATLEESYCGQERLGSDVRGQQQGREGRDPWRRKTLLYFLLKHLSRVPGVFPVE